MLYLLLTFVSTTFISNASFAQPDSTIDSLITKRKEFSTNENISFTVKFHNLKATPYHVRMVSTMSCACNNKDFCYTVYRIDSTGSRKVFLSHLEKPDSKKCTCKTQYAEFYNEKEYSIPPIKEKGDYIIMIDASGVGMSSNVFTVAD